jgi:curved DNA-binding protein CbpA
MINHYEILKVQPTASLIVIKAAYDALCKKYHPDNYQDEIKRAKAESVIKRLNEAFEILSDYKKRSDYDLKLKFIEDTDVILKDEEISSEIKQTDTSENILKQINFDKIKGEINKSVENVKTEVQHSINENITSKVDLNKVKGNIAKSVENTKIFAEKIENSVHEKIKNIDFDAIKSDIKDKIHTLDSNAEKKVKKDTEIDNDFYQKITTETEDINLDQNHHGETQKSKFSFAVIRIFVLLFSVLIYNNFDYLKSFITANDLKVIYPHKTIGLTEDEIESMNILLGSIYNNGDPKMIKSYPDFPLSTELQCKTIFSNIKEYARKGHSAAQLFLAAFANPYATFHTSYQYKWDKVCPSAPFTNIILPHAYNLDERGTYTYNLDEYRELLLAATDISNNSFVTLDFSMLVDAMIELSHSYRCGGRENYDEGFKVDYDKAISSSQDRLSHYKANESLLFKMTDEARKKFIEGFYLSYFGLAVDYHAKGDFEKSNSILQEGEMLLGSQVRKFNLSTYAFYHNPTILNQTASCQ